MRLAYQLLKTMYLLWLLAMSGHIFAVDTDGDGINDNIDAFPIDSAEAIDTDSDGIGNNADTDDDNDLVLDDDTLPLDSEYQYYRPIVMGALDLHDKNFSSEEIELFSNRFAAINSLFGKTSIFLRVVKRAESIKDIASDIICTLLPSPCSNEMVINLTSELEPITDDNNGYRQLRVETENNTYQIIFVDEFDTFQNQRAVATFRAYAKELIGGQLQSAKPIPDWWRDAQQEYLSAYLLSSMQLSQSFGTYHQRLKNNIPFLISNNAPLDILQGNYTSISEVGIIRLVHDYGMKSVFLDFYDHYRSSDNWYEAFENTFGVSPSEFSESLESDMRAGFDFAGLREPNDMLDSLEQPWQQSGGSARTLFDLAPLKLLASIPYANGDGCTNYLTMESHEFGDFNGDGYQDLILTADENNGGGCSAPTSVVAIYGAESHQPPVMVLVDEGALGGRDTVVADINGDGFDDLLVAGARHKDDNYAADSPSISGVHLYLGSKTGLINDSLEFDNQTLLDLNNMTSEFATHGDIDGDSIEEFFLFGIGDGHAWPKPVVIDCDLSCVARHPPGFDAGSYPNSGGVSIYNAVLVDLDGDEDLDILINLEVDPLYFDGTPFVSKRYAHAAYYQLEGSFDMSAAPVELDMGFRLDENTEQPITDDDRILDPTASHYWESELIDLTGDHHIELVTLENNQFHISNARFLISLYSWNAENGQYQLADDQPEDTGASHDQNFHFKDLNGDSRLDIISTLKPGPLFEHAISLHQNLSSGWSLSKKSFSHFMQENNCNRIYAPDFDSDGNLDVIITCPRFDSLEIYYGKNQLLPDRDHDSIPDGQDQFPLAPIGDLLDSDNDGAPNDCGQNCLELGMNDDEDDDNDGISDIQELSDGTDPLDRLDLDSDHDGYTDLEDEFPLDSSEQIDTDGDGVGNNADADDDNDSISDKDEVTNGTDPLSVDTDGDGVGDKADVFALDASESGDFDGDGIGDNTDAVNTTLTFSEGVFDISVKVNNPSDNPVTSIDLRFGGLNSNHTCFVSATATEQETQSEDVYQANFKWAIGDNYGTTKYGVINDTPVIHFSDGTKLYDQSQYYLDLTNLYSVAPQFKIESFQTTQTDIDNEVEFEIVISGFGEDGFLLKYPTSSNSRLDIKVHFANSADYVGVDFGQNDVEKIANDRYVMRGKVVITDTEDFMNPKLKLVSVCDASMNGKAWDQDSDQDGMIDALDAFPSEPNEYIDSDGDGTGNNADIDDDGDTVSDVDEATSGTNPLLADTDRDGFSDAQELIDATDPLDKDDCATCTPPVSGIAYHWNNHALLESVDVSLVGLTDGIENDFAEQSLSSASGQYAFTQKHRGTNGMTASKAITARESGSVISSADALAALKIAVGINPNTDPDGAGPEEALPVSPYQYIAADINGDGRITSADALAILKMAVKLDSAEPRRWVFVAEDYEFWDQASKSFLTTRTDVTWNNSGMTFEYPEKSVQNVVGVLMGDVNGNWSAPEGSEAIAESHLAGLVDSRGGSLAQWGKYDTQSAVAQPNILLIIADDQGVDASAQYPLSVDVPTTPILNKLASEGIVFDNAWATPACTTSRATMMTGQYGVNSGVVSNDDSVSSNALTLHRYLANSPNSSNYASALIGKWGLGGSGVAANHPATLGIEYFAGTLRRAISDYNAWDLTVNGVTTATSVYNTTASTDLAIDWIANQSQPWFLWLAYTAPHDPIHVPPRHLHTRNLSGTDSDISSNPRAYYLAAIEAMDSEIGRLLQSFDEQQLENTIILYVGDNGTPTSVIDTTVFSKGKSSVSEGGLKVPMIVSGAGVSRENSRESALINVTDFFATISQLAGNDTPQIADSISFMGLLSNADSPSKEYSYVDFMTNGITRWAIRDERYKLIVSSSGSKQLYDLLNDPYEDTNLLRAGEQYQSIESRLFTAGMAIRPQTDGAEHTAGIECSYSYDVFNDSAWVDMQSWADWRCDDTQRTLTANGVPDHAVGTFPNAHNPNTISAQTISAAYTLSPEKTATPTTMGGPRGVTGYVLNGVKLDPGTAGTCSDNGTSCRLAPPKQGNWSIEALGQDSFNFGDDENHAHVQPTGAYHYHGIPEGFVSKLNKGEAMTHIGWAADGFPIYARYGYSDPADSDSSIVVVQSSYQLKTSPDANRAEVSMYPMGTFTQDYEYVEGSGHLDECNGRTGVTPQFPEGIYHYFATDTFPFLQRCVRGGL